MKEKCVLMLGAGLMQRPAIKAIQELGFEAVVIDKDKNAVCAEDANYFYAIDLKDTEAILQLAQDLSKKKTLVGCMTAGTDFSSNVAAVCERFGLQGHTLSACQNASNKKKMRQCFKDCHVPSPKYMTTKKDNITQEELMSFGLHFPLVIKPVDNMGARGCRLLHCKKDIEEALPIALANSRTKEAIIEEYMEGKEFSIDAVVYEGTLTITGFADRHIYFPPYFVEMGHTMPLALSCGKNELPCGIQVISKEEYFEIIRVFAKGVEALGLSLGAAKGDMKLTKKGAMIGEIAARLSGGYMSGWTFPYASDCNLTKELAKIACSMPPDYIIDNRVLLLEQKDLPFCIYDIPCKRASAERAWISLPGKIKEITGLDCAKKAEGIQAVFPRLKAGDEAVFPSNNVEKCGNVISTGKTIQEAIKNAQNAAAKIVICLEPNTLLQNFFEKPLEKQKQSEEGIFFAYHIDIDFAFPLLLSAQGIIIPKDMPLKKSIPSCIMQKIEEQKQEDYNHRTLLMSILLFDELRKEHPAFSLKTLLEYTLKGGIQGMLLLCDGLLQDDI